MSIYNDVKSGKYSFNNMDPFWKDLFKHLNIPEDHPKARVFKSIVFELGHSYGFSEIVSYAEDVAPLMK